jgi:CDP-4-dehydro-6-deoxyglucose reductase
VVYQVRVAETEQAFEVAADETILAAARRANVKLAHDCELGGCGTCRNRRVEGSVTYAEFPLALTPEEECQGYALACQAMPAGDLVISPARGLTEMPQAVRHHAMVSAIRPLSARVMHLVLEIPGMAFLNYRPGQYMNVILPDGITRSFSMASIPRDKSGGFSGPADRRRSLHARPAAAPASRRPVAG